METVESSIGPVLQALSTDGKVDLAELVRKKDQDVAEKVKVLRAGGSVDPERWLKRAAHLLHQKNFADALFCFKKANDPRGIAHSQAWLYEQEGRSRRAINDLEGSTASYEKAIVLFIELELFSDASACYQAIGRYDKAAGMDFVDPTCNSFNPNLIDRNLEEPRAARQSCTIL
jgi:tetratricopeptide (TPR) repeat protein